MKKYKVRILVPLFLVMLLAGAVFNHETRIAKAAANIKVEATHPAMNTIKLSWDKVSGAAGYNIYCSETQDGTYKLVSSIVDTAVIFDNLDTDTFYYFKVVSYSVKNGVRVEEAKSDVIKERSNSIGIDVSKWNGFIDWNKVKEDGIDFAMVRVSYGLSTTAENLVYNKVTYYDMYKRNIEGATKAGIPVGVYTYSTAMTTAGAVEEAKYVLKLIEGYQLDYPVVFDIEDDKFHEDLSKAQNTKLVKAFMDVIEDAGYEVMLYTGDSFSRNKLNMDELTMYEWWIPHYATSDYYYPYNGHYHFRSSCVYNKHYHRMWQYTERGKVKGITGYVDMNYELDIYEETTGIVYVDMQKNQQRYVADDVETIQTIAEKFDTSIEELISLNPKYNESSKIEKGQSVVIDTLALTVPHVTAKMASSTSIRLTYDAVPLAEGYEIYHSTSKNGTYKKIKTTDSLQYTHTKVSASATNYYKVVAYRTINGVYEEAPSSVVSCKISLDKVAGLKAASNGYNSVKVTWNKVTNAAGYKVYSSTSKNGTYKLIKTTTSTSYTNTGLTNNKTVYYKVRAYAKGTDKEVESSLSGYVSATPVQAPATALKASSVTNNSAKLSWTKAAGATSYKVYRATSLNGKYTSIATVTSNTYTNKSLTKNKTYYYKVRAIKKVGKVEYQAQVTAALKVVIAAPVKLTAPKITEVTGYDNRVYMEWSTVKNATGYEIYRSTSKTGTYKRVIAKKPTFINNTGLTKNKTYYYKVRAYQTLNGKTTYSAYSGIISVKTCTILLPTPKITAVKGYSGKITMSWSAVKGVTGYEIYRSTSKNGTYSLVTSKSGTSINNTGLGNKKTYYYKVRSYHKVNSQINYSNYSMVVSAKTL